MRWRKRKKGPSLGSTRTVKKFLWLPKTLNGETRWFERGLIFQRCVSKDTKQTDLKWVDVSWEN